MMYPNPNFIIKYFPDAEFSADEGRDGRSSCLRIGTFMVIEKLMMECIKEEQGQYIYLTILPIRRFGVNETTVERAVFPSDERKEELMNAVINSDKSYEEILAFVRGEVVE